jgi:hypothetical protein
MPHPYTEANGREWIAHVQQDHATGHPRRFAIALKETDRKPSYSTSYQREERLDGCDQDGCSLQHSRERRS